MLSILYRTLCEHDEYLISKWVNYVVFEPVRVELGKKTTEVIIHFWVIETGRNIKDNMFQEMLVVIDIKSLTHKCLFSVSLFTLFFYLLKIKFKKAKHLNSLVFSNKKYALSQTQKDLGYRNILFIGLNSTLLRKTEPWKEKEQSILRKMVWKKEWSFPQISIAMSTFKNL